MVGSGRGILPDRVVARATTDDDSEANWRHALESIRDLAAARTPGALGQILAISLDALRQPRV